MATRTAKRKGSRPLGFDAFFSHASREAVNAKRLIRALKADSQAAWIDSKNVGAGTLLRPELHDAIRDSRVFVLATPLPQFLGNALYLDRKRAGARLGRELASAVRNAPPGPTKVAPVILGRTKEIEELCEQIGAGQYRIMAQITVDLAAAEKANNEFSAHLQMLHNLAPGDPLVVSLLAYQFKNTYMIKYWLPIQAGRAPKDRLLARAERHFFDVLCINPSDENAINGLGTVLFFERELEAAAFFQRRAVALAKKRGLDYTAAKSDLNNTLLHMRRQA